MNHDQKTVAIGAISGVAIMVALVALLYWLLPEFAGYDEPITRLIFTLRSNALALLPLFIGIITISYSRFFSAAIDPLRQAESRSTQVNIRFVNNTLEQTFLFVLSTMALSTFLDAKSIKLILAHVIVFILTR